MESDHRVRFPAASDTSDRRRKREQMSTLRFSTGSLLYCRSGHLDDFRRLEVLRRARIRDLERGESVNKYLGDVLGRYAGTTNREAIDSLLSLTEESRASSGDGERG